MRNQQEQRKVNYWVPSTMQRVTCAPSVLEGNGIVPLCAGELNFAGSWTSWQWEEYQEEYKSGTKKAVHISAFAWPGCTHKRDSNILRFEAIDVFLQQINSVFHPFYSSFRWLAWLEFFEKLSGLGRQELEFVNWSARFIFFFKKNGENIVNT